jgi:hypothetical protein
MFYQLLTGKKPFEGTGFALQKKIIQDDPVWPSALIEVADTFDRVVARALAKEPDHRYPNAKKFAEDLKRLAAGKEPEAPSLSAPKPEAAPASNSTISEAEKEFWNEVKDSSDPEDVKLYLDQFPKGMFADAAKKKLAELGG